MRTTEKRQLGIERLAIQIHDASFPSEAFEDWGRGSPYSKGAERFFEFVANLGFNVIQLGPQGLTQRGNPSPYDSTLFSRNPLNLPLGRFVEQERLSERTLKSIRVADDADSTASQTLTHVEMYDRFQIALAEIIFNASKEDRQSAREYLERNEWWLVPDALYAPLCREHEAPWWPLWGRSRQGTCDQQLFCPDHDNAASAKRRVEDLRKKYSREIEDYALVQWLLEVEHQSLRSRIKPLGLMLFADLQVGLSPQDIWAWQGLFLQSFRMGAPPSRTNPDGQPWGYSVFDPGKLGTLEHAGPALEFVRARLRKVLEECDGVRIDHPHGWIDPWVYRSDDHDPFHAVQNGARLYSSPSEADHSVLQHYAVARREQIDYSQARYADRRVHSLDDAQVAKYSILVDTIVEQALAHGRQRDAIACEVLSTLPYPIQRVLERHGLGRFRVAQKAKLDDATDVYRIENSQPQDWIMLGNHDTPTIWELSNKWCQGGEHRRWAKYLAELRASGHRVPEAACETPSDLAHSIFCAVLGSKARNVMIFFPDLLGMTERYNQPGVVAEANWRMRVPRDFATSYAKDCRDGKALDVVRCLVETSDCRP